MSLGINYGTLRREVGRFLGFSRDPSTWNANEIQDVQDVIDSGLRQFYRPPRLPEERYGYQWRFTKPVGYLTIQTGEWDYDMPADFAGLAGDLYFVETDFVVRAVQVVNEARIHALRQRYWDSLSACEPEVAALSAKRSSGIADSTYQLLLWPKPDRQYTVKFRYFARQRALRSDEDVPMGASEHAEAIRASCMAAAEAHLDDERGAKWEIFIDQLRASIDFDRKAAAPQTLGRMDDPGTRELCGVPYQRSIGGLVTHAAFPVDPDPTPPPGGESVVTQDGETVITQDGDVLVPQPEG